MSRRVVIDRGRPRAGVAGCALLVGLIGGVGSARAQGADVALRAAEAFDEGLARKEAGDWAGACAAFAESERLAPAVTVEINLAECARHAGDLLEATAILRRAIAAADAKGDRVRGDKARLDLTAVVALTPLIAFDLSPEPGLVATIDGRAVADLATAVAVNPGRHTVVVTVDGAERVRRDVELGPSAIERIGATPRASTIPVPGTTALPSAAPPSTEDDTAPAGRPRRFRVATIGLGLGAFALAAGGSYLLGRAYQLTDDAEAACPDNGAGCDAPRANALWADAVTRSRIGVGALAGAGVMAGVAAGLWWIGRPSATSLALAPTARGGTVVVRGRF